MRVRRWLVAGVLILSFAGLMGIGAVALMLGGLTAGSGSPGGPCDAVVAADVTDAGPAVRVRSVDLDAEQRGIVELIISIGKERQLPPRAWQVAIQAGMTESRLRNLDYGDRDSLGIFQMRPSMGWGTVAQVTDPVYQVNKFYDVLLEVPNWETQRPGDSAQDVERSAFPDRYHDWEPLAVELIEIIAGDVEAYVQQTCDPELLAASAVPPSQVAATAIAFSLREIGKPYVWGATGPNSYDCSGLMLRAYESAGITIPRVSRDQYNGGTKLPVAQAQPGDLIFWGRSPSNRMTIYHVAMYLGNGQMVEAANRTVPLRTRAISWDESNLMPYAVRPGVATPDQ